MAEERKAVALGALATAAAHKLGSPLNTITVVTHELAGEIHSDDPIHEDVQLLRTEAERCRLILRELDAYRLVGKPDLDTKITITALVEDIFGKVAKDAKIDLSVIFEPDSSSLPSVYRRPEIVQALEALLHNAESFAAFQVRVVIVAGDEDIRITIDDDGVGFSELVLTRIGQPWNSTRSGVDGHRGLGIFVAQTLIEAVGGSIYFGNNANGGGEVRIILPVSVLTGTGAD